MSDAERQTIDTEIEGYSIAIPAPKTRWNVLDPVSKLPPEIICKIFHFVKSSPDFPPHDLAWIKVTHVCADWRHLALNSATLWSTPSTTNPQWLDEMLRRSKMAGLTIKFDFRAPSPIAKTPLLLPAFRQILQEHGSRIQHLAITNVDEEVAPLLHRLPESAPQLETLCITSGEGFEFGIWKDRPDVFYTIPEGAFTNAENLRSIEMAGVDARWDLRNLCNLTRLKLHDLAASTSVMLDRFIALLGTMPKLEYLDLKDVPFPTTGSIQEGDCGTVDLPHLRQLILNFSRTDAILAFLPCLVVPPHTTVGLTFDLKHNHRTDLSGIISQISTIYSRGTSSGQDFRALATRRHVPFNCMGIYLYSQISEYMLGSDIAELSLRIFLHDAPQDSDYLLSQIFASSLPLDKISHASLGYSVLEAVSETLEQTVGSIPALSSITVRREDERRYRRIRRHSDPDGLLPRDDRPPQDGRHPFFEALIPRSETLDADGRPIYFRNLISIDMVGLVFQTPEDIEPGHNVDLGELLQCLIQRSECGAKIERLKLKGCYGLKTNLVDEVREVVADVEWDGMIQRKNEYEDVWN